MSLGKHHPAAWFMGILAMLAWCCASADTDLGSVPNSEATNVTELKMLDCYYAPNQDKPSCEKEGYFISGFEDSIQILSISDYFHLSPRIDYGPDIVPAARALCCRAEIPAEWLQQSRLATERTPPRITSVGCYTSSYTMKCETDDNSFLRRFTNSLRLSSSPSTAYPADAVECCTPALLMSSGDAWSIERCGCTKQEKNVSCASPSFLWGYDSKWSTQDFHPRNPAMCCKFCLGRAYYRLRDCWISCKGNGICVSGTCKCMRGFPEPFCSNATDTRDSEHPLPSRSTYSDHEESIDYSFMIPLFLVVVAILFCVKVFICCSPVSDSASTSIAQTAAPASPNARIERVPRTETQRRDTSNWAAVARLPLEPHDTDVHISNRTAAHDPSPGTDGNSDLENAPLLGDSRLEESSGDMDLSTSPDASRNRKSCKICFTRRINVVLVPCGHANMCRRCARACTDCPFCRTRIERLQNFFSDAL